MGKKYFACANSGKGFVNYFDSVLNDMNKVYIIKGGPGCGKSTLMKRIGEEYSKKGFDVDYIYCSSDSDSLDGVILNDYGIAIVDGTAPHIIEPKIPGVIEEYINFSDVWDGVKLMNNKETIKELQGEISLCYKNAYMHLKKAKSAHDKLEKIYIESSDFSKTDIIYSDLTKKINLMLGELTKPIDKND